ncbi:MAG: SHOCT domain-containing protein [Firmicutes bacterium]|jgi:uncharacterized membrane protein|nr:SHOCT domain-containing protein [Bacillota bacterium]MCL5014831.1 SHOCT domain-containing protein [Bacillota bacterium]
MEWGTIVFLPFMITMMILAASTAFYHQSPHEHDGEISMSSRHPQYLYRESTADLEKYQGKTPLEIAQERYARGEMTHEEFDIMVKRLQESRHSWQKW